MSNYEQFCLARGLHPPEGLTALLSSKVASILDGLLYRPDVPDRAPNSLATGLALLQDSLLPPPSNLVPLVPADDASIACAICFPMADPPGICEVVRWHLRAIPTRYQGAVLDADAVSYLRSVADEVSQRSDQLSKIRKIAARYQREYVSRGRTPRSYVKRPVQLACQNVIVGLACLQYDSSFDGLRVEIFQTCEVPHLATHEANRALAALVLCDAFQSGGTMEIRFGPRHKEEPVPPGLRRFGRCHGLELGAVDPCAIVPEEARGLFLAVTPIPSELWLRALDLMDRGLCSPERLCFSLMSPIWTAVELDYLLATSSRIDSILGGGASPFLRSSRLPELEVARAAVMIGALHRRLDSADAAADSSSRSRGEVRSFEDTQLGVTWAVDSEKGAVAFCGVSARSAPWSRCQDAAGSRIRELIVVPRGLPTHDDSELVVRLQKEADDVSVALLVPSDLAECVPEEVPLLVYPGRLSELDTEIDRRLEKSRLSRS